MKTTGSVILGPKTAARILDLGEPRGSRHRGRAAFAISCAIGLVAAHEGTSGGFLHGGGSRPKEVDGMRGLTSLAMAGAVAVGSGALAQDAVQWRVEDGGNGHWYKVIIDGVGCWSQHRETAAFAGGHLASITSASENQFAASIAPAAFLNIGGIQSPGACEPHCGWQWITGEPWSYTDWDSAQPDGGDSQNRLAWFASGWHDAAECPPYTGGGFLIEWSADCNGDGIVDYGQIRTGELDDANGNNVPDCCEQGTSCVGGNHVAQWRVEDGGNGHWYECRLFNPATNWNTMRAAAESENATLATITSAAENAFIYQLSLAGGAWAELGRPMIGGRKQGGCGQMEWITGEPFVYSNWLSGEPNGWCYEPVLGLIVNTVTGAPSDRWNDYGEDVPSSSAIFEWSADCNGDGIVDYGQIRTGELDDANGNNVPDCCEPGASCTGDLDLGLVAHYPFDGNCLDASGFARHGEPTGISFTTDQVGRPGSAARFSGNGSQMLVQGIPIPTDNAFAWALWIRPDSVGDSGSGTPLLERIEAIGSNPLSPSLFIRANAGLGFGSYGQFGGSSVETPASIVSPAVWTHIACTSTAAGVRRVFVNGELVGEGTSPDYGGALGLLLVGRDRLDCCGIFRGAMDDLRIYSRPLSTSEVQALIELGQPPACNADVTGNGSVDAVDLAAVLAAWGNVGKGKAAADVNADGTVDALDLAEVLSGWGPCP